ncbi:MAG TPA: desulfoferrodoxin family protein [Bacillota bacterium]|nr:desulfoferrodoxin family protein [Bacillota bacterium]HUM56583.1 desulfoferrodoxin family protein [Bacillota bacterium]
MMKKFYVCRHCGNIVLKVKDAGVPLVCCGENMTELIPGTVDAALEKHVPKVTVSGSTITALIGEVTHPMQEEHFIEWIYLETEKGAQIKYLKPGEEPKAVFEVADGDKALAVYEHCNLHGLWKSEV